jgi:diaminohydroxyphosphoribosylaminopyrimidine deaminase / 5-amino-6-(5-phosphoribosylamino)uracil reductase
VARVYPAELMDAEYMRAALRLARRGFGCTSPNPMVGAVLVRRGKIIGRGWHRRAGWPHAEIEALADARRRGNDPGGSDLFVTLEPCSTHGLTPPCTDAIISAGIKRVVVGAIDPNPRHAGRGFSLLRKAGVEVVHGILGAECQDLNEAFNHWIVHSTPFVMVKAAMTLDGKIATATGESKWITSDRARSFAMRLRRAADAIVVGINTVIADDPSLTVRPGRKALRRIVLDPAARTPPSARLVSDEHRALTTIVISPNASRTRVSRLRKLVEVIEAPLNKRGGLDLRWLLRLLGRQKITNLLVEGGGETNASFLLAGLAHRVAFFYAPKILGGRDSRPGVGGDGVETLKAAPVLENISWRKIGPDLLMQACVRAGKRTARSSKTK